MPIRTDKEGRWHIELCIQRQRIHRRLPEGSTKEDAKNAEAEVRQSFKSRAFTADPSLAEVMALYMDHANSLRSTDTAEFHALRMGEWIHGRKASDAKLMCAQMIPVLLKTYKPATVNRSLGTLKKALSMAWERGIIPTNYGEQIKRLKENNEREVFLTIEEVEKIAHHASDNVRAAIWIAIYTGMRRGEIIKLNEAEIGASTLTILSGNTKTLKRRTVPIVEPLREWLAFLPLIIGAEGIKSGFRRAREAAGMGHVNFHDMRHSTASMLVAAGVDLYIVGEILGHSSTRTTQRYAHVQTDQKRKALAKVFG